MSLNTNQSSGTANQQAMAALGILFGEPSSISKKELNKSFIGRKIPEEQSDEVTTVEYVENSPQNNNKELGQCHRYKKGPKGQLLQATGNSLAI